MTNTATCELCDVATTLTRVSVDRALWTKHKSTALFQDIVPGRETFSIQLAKCSLIFLKRNSCVVSFLWNSELLSLCGNWEPMYRAQATCLV